MARIEALDKRVDKRFDDLKDWIRSEVKRLEDRINPSKGEPHERTPTHAAQRDLQAQIDRAVKLSEITVSGPNLLRA